MDMQRTKLHFFAVFQRFALPLIPPQQAQRAFEIVQRGQRHIFHHVMDEDEPLFLSVLGDQHHAVLDRFARVANLHFLAVQLDAPRAERIGAEQASHGLGAPRADQAEHAENLAAVDRKRNISKLFAA